MHLGVLRVVIVDAGEDGLAHAAAGVGSQRGLFCRGAIDQRCRVGRGQAYARRRERVRRGGTHQYGARRVGGRLDHAEQHRAHGGGDDGDRDEREQ